PWAAMVILVATSAVSLLLTFDISFQELLHKIMRSRGNQAMPEEEEGLGAIGAHNDADPHDDEAPEDAEPNFTRKEMFNERPMNAEEQMAASMTAQIKRKRSI